MSEGQILGMLERGIISADQAAKLLEATSADSHPAAPDQDPTGSTASVEPDQVIPGSLGPDAVHWRRIQQIPFALSLTVLIISAWGLYAIYQGAARITFGWVVVLVVFLAAVLATTVTFWMLTAPWLHVRIQERDGKRIAISLPLPLTLATWGVQIARRYVDDRTAEHLATSAEFLKAMRAGHKQETDPIVVNVDEDGHRVQVYIG